MPERRRKAEPQDQGSLDEPVADVSDLGAPHAQVENAAELAEEDGDGDVDRAVDGTLRTGVNVPRERFPWEGNPASGK